MVMNITHLVKLYQIKKKFKEVSVTMNYPSKKLYQNATCYRLASYRLLLVSWLL